MCVREREKQRESERKSERKREKEKEKERKKERQSVLMFQKYVFVNMSEVLCITS